MKLVLWLVGFFVIIGAFVFFLNSNQRKETTQIKESTQSAQPMLMRSYDKFPGVLTESELRNKRALIKTAKGDILMELFGSETPKATSNFIFLAREGFYNGLTFHRREERFIIQGGDPNGDGTGGPGYQFEDEPITKEYERGIVAMANSGPNTNGSQFFIMLSPISLPRSYTIFGSILSEKFPC